MYSITEMPGKCINLSNRRISYVARRGLTEAEYREWVAGRAANNVHHLFQRFETRKC